MLVLICMLPVECARSGRVALARRLPAYDGPHVCFGTHLEFDGAFV